jgi:hypothetical protein
LGKAHTLARELDLDELREDFLGQCRPEFGVERGGVERVVAIALVPLSSGALLLKQSFELV